MASARVCWHAWELTAWSSIRRRPLLQLACARLGMPWEDAVWVSIHARPFENLRQVLGRHATIGVLTDSNQTPEAICRWLVEAQIDEYDVAVLENLGAANERLSQGRPQALLGQTLCSLERCASQAPCRMGQSTHARRAPCSGRPKAPSITAARERA